MRIDVPDDLAKRIMAAIESFESIDGQLRRMNRRLDRIEGIEGQSAVDLTKLFAEVAAGRTVDESTKTLVQGIAAELADDPSPRIRALAASLKESTDTLSKAVQDVPAIIKFP